jgi:hypothetical protein
VDWGQLRIALEAGGIRMRTGTGVLWRIRRVEGPQADSPPAPVVLPVHAARVALGGLALAGAVAGLVLWRRRSRRAAQKRTPPAATE